MKAQVDQVMKTARNSLKLLETLERESLAKAKKIVKLKERKRQTNARIQSGLKSSLKTLGLATEAEVNALKVRVAELEKLTEQLARAAGLSK
jgi:hypothetical protein